jgi:hypothetical protein
VLPQVPRCSGCTEHFTNIEDHFAQLPVDSELPTTKKRLAKKFKAILPDGKHGAVKWSEEIDWTPEWRHGKQFQTEA